MEEALVERQLITYPRRQVDGINPMYRENAWELVDDEALEIRPAKLGERVVARQDVLGIRTHGVAVPLPRPRVDESPCCLGEAGGTPDLVPHGPTGPDDVALERSVDTELEELAAKCSRAEPIAQVFALDDLFDDPAAVNEHVAPALTGTLHERYFAPIAGGFCGFEPVRQDLEASMLEVVEWQSVATWIDRLRFRCLLESIQVRALVVRGEVLHPRESSRPLVRLTTACRGGTAFDPTA